MAPDDLDRILIVLRKHNVSRFADGTLAIVLGDVPETDAQSRATTNPDLCACGHSIDVEHNETGCIALGNYCSAAECAGSAS